MRLGDALRSNFRGNRPPAREKSPKKSFALLIVLIFFILLLSPIGMVLAHQDDHNAEGLVNSISQVWRQVREGVAGYSAVSGQETDELIQGSGQNWRQLRNGPIATYAVWLFGITGFGIGGFYLVRGQVKLAQPRSGRKVKRWSAGERLLHWFTAIIFIVLTITGLSLLYGRAVLIPLIGKAEFAAYADLAKIIHNYTGPAFIVGLLLMIVTWFKDNLPKRIDIRWLLEFGGMIGNKHPSAGRINAGEKLWFWLLVFAGVAVCITGLILDFPNLGLDRLVLQISHLIHLILAIVLIVGSLAHMYIGTLGTEGAFEGMVSGKVDVTWAKQHHDLWYEELQRNNKDNDGEASMEAGIRESS